MDMINHLITNEIPKHHNRRIILQVTQLQTNHSCFRNRYQIIGIKKGSYNHRCGELETARDTFVDCPLLDLQQQGLGRVSLEMDLPTLLKIVTILREIVKVIPTKRN